MSSLVVSIIAPPSNSVKTRINFRLSAGHFKKNSRNNRKQSANNVRLYLTQSFTERKLPIMKNGFNFSFIKIHCCSNLTTGCQGLGHFMQSYMWYGTRDLNAFICPTLIEIDSNNFEYSGLERFLWWDLEFRVLIFWHFDRLEWSECIHRSILVTCHLSPDWSLSPTSSAKLMSNLNLKIIWTRLLRLRTQSLSIRLLRRTYPSSASLIMQFIWPGMNVKFLLQFRLCHIDFEKIKLNFHSGSNELHYQGRWRRKSPP